MLATNKIPTPQRRTRRKSADRVAYDVPEVARLLGMSAPTVYRMARSGEIPAIISGKRIVIPRSAFERFLANVGQPTQAA